MSVGAAVLLSAVHFFLSRATWRVRVCLRVVKVIGADEDRTQSKIDCVGRLLWPIIISSIAIRFRLATLMLHAP